MRAFLLAALALAACGPSESPDPVDVEPEPTAATAPPDGSDTPYFVLSSRGGGTYRYGDTPTLWGDTTGLRARAMERMGDMRGYLDQRMAFETAADWREADALARRAAGPDSLVSHELAVKMLDRHLLRGPLDADRADALDHYTRVLLTHGSSEGAVLLVALRRLGDRWPDADRQRAASATADRLGGAFAQVAGCVGCTVEEALAGMWPEARRSSEDVLYDMEADHRALMAMASDGTPMPDDP